MRWEGFKIISLQLPLLLLLLKVSSDARQFLIDRYKVDHSPDQVIQRAVCGGWQHVRASIACALESGRENRRVSKTIACKGWRDAMWIEV